VLSAGVPFGLLYLRAQLPACQGDSRLTIDLLHYLRCYCQQQLAHQQHGHFSKQQLQQQQPQTDVAFSRIDQQESMTAETAENTAAVGLWQHRLCGVTCSLVLHHWQAGSVAAALQLLDQQLLLQPADCQLWSLAGRLFLQLNVMKQAQRCFTKVQQLVQEQVQQQQQQQGEVAGCVQLQQLVRHNWGCYNALSNNMTVALHEFETAQQITAAAASDVTDTAAQTIQTVAAAAVDGVALSNSAVCLLHMGQLTEAISCLEAGLQQHPAEVAKVGVWLQQHCCCHSSAASTCHHFSTY
jgi:tetratricopeptide (TPR) repeat protein